MARAPSGAGEDVMWRPALVVVLLVTCEGCSLPLFNRTERIAVATLSGDQHTFDEESYSAAIHARFPAGTPLQEFEVFITRLKGTCHPATPEADDYWCEVPIRGGICWAELIGFDVTAEAGVISRVEVHIGRVSC